MGFFTKTKGAIISDAFKLLKTHGRLRGDLMYNVELYDDYLNIRIPMGKDDTTLRYDQITDIFYGVETEIVNKPKSVIGRAVAGGILFGSIGSVVGAVSGAGTKQKKEYHVYFIISYTSSSGESKFIEFEDVRGYRGAKVAKTLKELCGFENDSGHVEL